MNTNTLKKSNDKIIAGVCAGIAEYFGWQIHLVRILFVFAILLGASGLILYTILNVVMPNSNTDYTV